MFEIEWRKYDLLNYFEATLKHNWIYLQNCNSIPDHFTAETHSFHRECYQTFVKAKTLGKRKYFVTKKSRTDDNYATRRKRKNSLKVDLVLCSETFLSFVKSIDFSYKNKQVIWCNIQQKLFPKQQVQKWMLLPPETMTKKCFWLLQLLNWWEKSFKNTSTTTRTIQS